VTQRAGTFKVDRFNVDKAKVKVAKINAQFSEPSAQGEAGQGQAVAVFFLAFIHSFTCQSVAVICLSLKTTLISALIVY
jgi:hypothetical protein